MIKDKKKEITEIEIGKDDLRIKARGTFKDKDALDFVPTKESTLLHIDTPNYDGPLDLLLHLIRKHSMDIFDIPIVLITKKYLEALDEIKAMNLDIAGEFLLMAATLAEIKSIFLLPKEQRKTIDSEEEVDPRAELIKRLLQYKIYKEAAIDLWARPNFGKNLFLRPLNDILEENAEQSEGKEIKLSPVDIFTLIESLSLSLQKNKPNIVHVVSKERISISSRINELIEFCQLRPQFNFYDALKFFPVNDIIDVIVTFLALLEMSKLRLVKINNKNGELHLYINKENFYNEYHKHLNEQVNDDTKY